MERPAAIQLGDVIKDKGDVVTLEDTETLYDARNLMIQHSISRLVIFWDNKYAVGIITEKDIVRFLYKGTDGRRLDEITVKEAMSKSLVTSYKTESLIVKQNYPLIFFLPFNNARYIISHKITTSSSFSTGTTTPIDNKNILYLSENADRLLPIKYYLQL
jgi:CBS domain-containing protein